MAELKRTLGFWMTSAFVFLNLVNTGIFVAIALVMEIAGPAALFVMTSLALLSIYTAMCFSELTTMFPSAGGVYEFAKQAYGSFVSFEVGWIFWLINNIATALLVVAAVEYLFPQGSLSTLPVDAGTFKLLLAVAIILLMNYITYRGAEDSARLMLVLALFTLVLFLLAIIPGLFNIHLSSLRLTDIRITPLLLAAFLLSESFFGWESISFMAEEIKQPEKIIPRALIWTTVFTALATLAIATATIGVLGQSLQDVTRPIITLLQEVGIPAWLVFAANIGIVISFLGNAIGSVMGNPRLLLALSRDKLFIEQFADIHEHYSTPHRAIIVQTIVAVLIVIMASGAYQRLLEMVVAPSILLYGLLIFLVPYFRWTRPNQERPYRTPMGTWMPLVLVAAYACLLAIWAIYDPGAPNQLRLLASFMLFSAPIYLLLTYFYNPDALIGTVNRFAMLNLWLENFFVPKSLRQEILSRLPNAQGKTVLELGADVGSLTMPLAKHVGTKGTVLAVDFSPDNIRILQRRVLQEGHKHVRIIHDPHAINRVHPDVQHIDMAVSFGNLSYLQDTDKVLQEIADLLPRYAPVCFVDYINFFWFLPDNPPWLSDPEKIQEIFGRAGFSVNVRIKQSMFWKYVIIYGVKDDPRTPYV